MLPPSTRWHVAEPSSLLIQHWQAEDEYVAFNLRSGDLHLLNPAATAVLERLAEAPASVDDLRTSLNQVDPSALEAVLESLDRLGLDRPAAVTVGDLSGAELRGLLRAQRLTLRIGPFLVRLRSVMSEVQAALALLYRAHEIDTEADGAHFVICVDHPGFVRRFFRAQAQFTIDYRQPFFPLPASMAAPMLEAGLNWCIGNYANQFLVIHSATLERGGRALLMPAPPGSGKSTLCAALVARGWRLLSDEFALVDPATGLLAPVPRPVALKDASIDVIARWAPDALLGPSVVNNEGELVAYMRPPAGSVRDSGITCRAGWIVVPKYVAGSETAATPMTRARALMHLADNSFNYNFHGRVGFERLVAIADQAPSVTLRYSRLDEGVDAVDRLAQTSAP